MARGADDGRGGRAALPAAVLVVAACPPPIAGQSVATRMLLDHLTAIGARFETLDIGKELTETRMLGVVARGLRVLAWPAVLLLRWMRLGGRPVLYLQLGQSGRALLRDLLVLGTATMMRWPVIVHVHGGAFRRAFDALPWPLRAPLQAMLASVAAAVVLTPRLAGMFAGVVDASRVRVVSNGVEAELEADARGHVRERRPLQKVLYLSNLIESKGYLTFLEAAKRCQSSGRPYRFLLAGAATNQTTVDPVEFVANHGLENLDVIGPVVGPAKLRLLREADAFVLPTSYPVEGQPIAILEAMHYGLPVITTDAGGIADVIATERNGIIVPTGSPDAIVQALDRLAEDGALREAIGMTNRVTAREDYTERAHVRRITELLKQAER